MDTLNPPADTRRAWWSGADRKGEPELAAVNTISRAAVASARIGGNRLDGRIRVTGPRALATALPTWNRRGFTIDPYAA